MHIGKRGDQAGHQTDQTGKHLVLLNGGTQQHDDTGKAA